MNELSQRFRALTLARTGLALRDGDVAQAWPALQTRMRALRLSDAEPYLQLLERGTGESEAEWAQLMPHLTNGESYFFRDTGQIALIRERLLPELLKRNAAKKSLKLWSAGCSSGEEPYSLAMMLEELLPHREHEGWQISVLGMDINPQAVARGQRGVYRPWSLRAVSPELRERYFCETPDGWEVASRLREIVSFRLGNLSADPIPNPASGLAAMDLILCRNVLIYFDRASVARVLRKFSATLVPDGYLLTGHAELHPQDLGDLRPRLFPESVVYQRLTAASRPTSPATPAATPPPSSPASPLVARPSLVPLPTLPTAPFAAPPLVSQPLTSRASLPPLTPGSPFKATPPLASPSLPRPWHEALPRQGASADSGKNTGAEGAKKVTVESLLREAETHANAGRYDGATRCCEDALKLGARTAAPYLLLARIAEEESRTDEAVALLKKAIYLSPGCAMAYIELGAIYEGRGDATRARQMRQTALELLESSTSHDALEIGISDADRASDIQQLRALLEPAGANESAETRQGAAKR